MLGNKIVYIFCNFFIITKKLFIMFLMDVLQKTDRLSRNLSVCYLLHNNYYIALQSAYYEVSIIRVELNSGRRGKNLKNQLTCSIK